MFAFRPVLRDGARPGWPGEAPQHGLMVTKASTSSDNRGGARAFGMCFPAHSVALYSHFGDVRARVCIAVCTAICFGR